MHREMKGEMSAIGRMWRPGRPPLTCRPHRLLARAANAGVLAVRLRGEAVEPGAQARRGHADAAADAHRGDGAVHDAGVDGAPPHAEHVDQIRWSEELA